MLRRCLSCHGTFEHNDVLEQFPYGRRVAYDPDRGRLWAVCGSCARWSLAPLETRWETLEQLERITSGGARLLKQGENIALFGAGRLEVVRVGRADVREEAWWRYGSEFEARRKRVGRLIRRGKVIDALIALVLIGVPIWGFSDESTWIRRGQRRSFGKNAWRGLSCCPNCGHLLKDLRFEERELLILEPDGASFALWYSCPSCGAKDREAGHRLRGVAAEHVLRRVLAYQNFAGSSYPLVSSALQQVSSCPAPEQLIAQHAARLTPLGMLWGEHSLAAEIALNNVLEARLLEEELAVLELRWREEETLAAIIDGELTPG